MYDYLLLFGRFQPPHRGHLRVIEEGLRRSHRLIVLCGAVDVPRSIRNPWTFDERLEMLRAFVAKIDLSRVRVVAAPDNLYRPELWAASVRKIVDAAIAADERGAASAQIGILGTVLDDRDKARRLFEVWPWVDVEPLRSCSAAGIRAQVLGADDTKLDPQIPSASLPLIRAIARSAEFAALKLEFAANERFRTAWSCAPWPPVFVTVDAVVVAHGQLLLVERAQHPGKGLWALPGGFLDAHETLLAACVRELREETNIVLDPAVLTNSVRSIEVFDDPERSARGRTITHAYLFDLAAVPGVPGVEGGDDARIAKWFPLDAIRRNGLFEDHYAILQAMLGIK